MEWNYNANKFSISKFLIKNLSFCASKCSYAYAFEKCISFDDVFSWKSKSFRRRNENCIYRIDFFTITCYFFYARRIWHSFPHLCTFTLLWISHTCTLHTTIDVLSDLYWLEKRAWDALISIIRSWLIRSTVEYHEQLNMVYGIRLASLMDSSCENECV